MSEFFESIKQGLNEAIEYEGVNLPNVKARRAKAGTPFRIAPLYIHNSDEIKEIRIQQNMTQRIFAEALGVSVKTVEAWEAGTNSPSGVASRMLELLKQDNSLFEKYSIVAKAGE